MSKKLVGSIGSFILVVAGVYFFSQSAFGNTDLMTTYLEDTQSITDDYLVLLTEEAMIEDDEELYDFTEVEVLPTLNRLVDESKQLEADYTNEKLLTVHSILIESLQALLEANEKWLEDSEEAENLFIKSDELYFQYEEDLEKLASKWGVEIVWE